MVLKPNCRLQAMQRVASALSKSKTRTSSGDGAVVVNLEHRLARLEDFYGTLSAPPHDPFILFVWEVLTFRSTPGRTDAALAALRRIPALTPDSMWKAPNARLEAAVALAGPYREQRLRALRTGIEMFRRSPRLPAIIRGPLPAARRALEPLPHLGEAGAHRMLLFAARRLVLPVDVSVKRVSLRLGYGAKSSSPRKSARTVQRALSRELRPSPEAFGRAFLYLSHHGAATCTEAEPHCTVCPLLGGCPEGARRTALPNA